MTYKASIASLEPRFEGFERDTNWMNTEYDFLKKGCSRKARIEMPENN